MAQLVWAASHHGGSEEAEGSFIGKTFTLSLSLPSGKTWGDAYGFLAIWFFRGRTGLSQDNSSSEDGKGLN
jgi:hypothetical protein